ncbi:hypothetical protein [Corynebacterium sp. AOP12-C2-36]|uniref:hypothetical protein n=1 Tax=Corynebacterium sp. AOP12-C2-36 TaxID=3457723 RepID=UPI0040349D31
MSRKLSDVYAALTRKHLPDPHTTQYSTTGLIGISPAHRENLMGTLSVAAFAGCALLVVLTAGDLVRFGGSGIDSLLAGDFGSGGDIDGAGAVVYALILVFEIVAIVVVLGLMWRLVTQRARLRELYAPNLPMASAAIECHRDLWIAQKKTSDPKVAAELVERFEAELFSWTDPAFLLDGTDQREAAALDALYRLRQQAASLFSSPAPTAAADDTAQDPAASV